MKKTKSKEKLGEYLDDIITNTDDNIYFTHITGSGLSKLFLVEGEGILTTKELIEKGYNEYDFEDEEIEIIYLEDKNFLKNMGLDLNDDEIMEIEEKHYKESTESFFEKGIYSEQNDIRSTATELEGDVKNDILDLVSNEYFHRNSRGNMVLILEIPKEYIYGEKKEQLFQDAEQTKFASGAHVDTFNKCIPAQFIKSAIITEKAIENEYFIIDNEMQRAKSRKELKNEIDNYDMLFTEEQLRLYNKGEKLGLDFKQELEDAKARTILRNEMREYFNGTGNLTIEEINARCEILGLNFNDEMTKVRDEKLPIATKLKESTKKVTSTQLLRNVQRGQTEIYNNYIEYENPSHTNDVEK